MSADLKNNVSKHIKQNFSKISYQDRRRLSLELRNFLKLKDEARVTDAALQLEERLNEALAQIQLRHDNMPKIAYDENLPVFAKKDEIISAIKEHQVVIIAGETGSGKTTQIPKMCLEAGCGIKGLIGHTQPRRIAARAVASRIAYEFQEELGKSVGYKVRFTDNVSKDSYIKIMTDGILLAETASDRLLLNYDCIIIDEAHERSLNIDFLLGYLKNLLKLRQELKLIITSATIDPERFSKHFNDAPIIEVSGRTYPVEVVYMPLDGTDGGTATAFGDDADAGDDGALEVRDGVLKAIKFLFSTCGPGDILVFLPGERDIMELSGFLNRSHLPGVEVLPLYARLATAEQNRIFTPHGTIRVVLATNVAETSLTVPGIRYVIDPGVARISRYSPRTKVQRLPVEKISQASANQRKGRCGRVSSGVCVRLYSQQDFEQRPLYTDPEILRTNLAAVILQMINLRLGDISTFPFIDAPEPRQVTDGLRLLEELGAIDKQQSRDFEDIKLTDTGVKLSKLPADPRLGRMLIEASSQGSLSEVLIIVSALSVMDPRERPLDKQEASHRMHQRFNDEKSDFLSFLKLYRYLSEQQKLLSVSAWKRKLKSEFLSYLRIREWFDVLRQLKASCGTLNFLQNQLPADYDCIHKSILSGLLSQIGRLDDNDKGYYLGARGVKFVIHPGSVLAGKSPKWICAGELSETSRLFARNNAVIDPMWLENLASHLIKRSYAEPFWSKKSGAVLANMTITLYGLPIVQNRKVQYAKVDPKLCRTLMIRDGLVHGDMECSFAFFRHNLELIDEVSHIEDKLRRRDLLADETVLEQFYDERLPKDVVTQRHFDKWWRREQQDNPNYLDFSLSLVAKDGLKGVKENLFPEYWQHDRLKLPLSYVFNPGAADDGVTVHIPITIINRIRSSEFLYQIQGLRAEFLSNLIKSLPKRLRRNLIPAPDYAKALDEALGGDVSGNLYDRAAKELTRMGGEVVRAEDFDKTQIPPHLFMNFSIEDLHGRVLAFGKNFDAIADKLQHEAQAALQKTVANHKTEAPSSSWTYGTIGREKVTRQNGVEIVAYPALTDKGKGVSLELYDSKTRQLRAMRQGLLKLLVLSVKQPTSYLEQHLPNKAKLSMYYQPLGSIKDLLDDLVKAAILLIMQDNKVLCWDENSFRRLLEQVKANLNEKALEISRIVEPSLYKAHELKRLLKGRIQLNTARCYADVNAQLDNLVFKGFVSNTPIEHLKDIPRYLQAASDRLEKLSRDPNRDLKYLGLLENVSAKYESALKLYQVDLIPDELKEIRWMIEELRVSYFAQQLGVKIQVSDKRIVNEINRILKEYPLHR